MAAWTSSAWIGDGGAMEGDVLRDGVWWHRGRDDSERFDGDGLESYPVNEFGPLELDQIPGFNSVVGQTGWAPESNWFQPNSGKTNRPSAFYIRPLSYFPFHKYDVLRFTHDL
jgi:hypothetical protein